MQPLPGSDGARPWWAPDPSPGSELEPISTRRAYTEVLLVFAAFFLAGVAAAAFLLANRNSGSVNGSWSTFVPATINEIAQTGLAVALVLLLAARRGVSARTLGLSVPRDPNGRLAGGAAVRTLGWALFALILGGIVNSVLQTGHLPKSTPNAPELIYSTFRSVNAGVVEELVVLAFVVVTLRQARRPWWEVTAVALVLRGSYHIYYGPGVFGILVWAALFYWIYLRTRNLWILMMAHAGWDTVSFFSQRWPGVGGVAFSFAVLVWLVGGITWLAERNRLPPATPEGAVAPVAYSAPPGWQPDPSGQHRWRWWDGQRWTQHVA